MSCAVNFQFSQVCILERFRVIFFLPLVYHSDLDLLSLLQATKQFLEEVNRWREQNGARPVARQTALRFLSARKFDVCRAIELLHDYRVSISICVLSLHTNLEKILFQGCDRFTHLCSLLT